MSIERINDAAVLNRRIKSVHALGAKFGEMLHSVAFNCLLAVSNSNDIRPLQALYDGLQPAGRDALQFWAAKFGKCTFSQKSKAFSYAKKAEADLVTAEAIGPMEYRKEKKPAVAREFVLRNEIEALLKRAIKHNAQGPAMDFLGRAYKTA